MAGLSKQMYTRASDRPRPSKLRCPRCGGICWPDLNYQRHHTGCPIRDRGKRWYSDYLGRAGSEASAELFTYFDVIEIYGDRCIYCGGKFEELDHYMPVSAGGPHTLANVRPSCSACNSAKADKILEDAR